MRSLLVLLSLGLGVGVLFLSSGERRRGEAIAATREDALAMVPAGAMTPVDAARAEPPTAARTPLASRETERAHRFVGRCVDQRGAALEGVLVEGVEQLEGSSTSDAQGRFELEFDPDRIERAVGRLALSRRGFTSVSLRLPRGVRGRVELGAKRMRRGGTLRGRAIDAERRPAADAVVYVTARAGGDPIQRSTRSDANGLWELAGLPYGDYGLHLRWRGTREQEPLRVELASTELELGDVVLAPARANGLLRGRVYGFDGTATSTALVHYAKSELSSDGGTLAPDPDGSFTLAADPWWKYELSAFDPTTGAVSASVEATGGGAEIALRLGAPPPFELWVTDEEGLPVSEFSYQIWDVSERATPGEAAPITRHEGGIAEIPRVDRPIRLTIRAEGFETRTLSPTGHGVPGQPDLMHASGPELSGMSSGFISSSPLTLGAGGPKRVIHCRLTRTDGEPRSEGHAR